MDRDIQRAVTHLALAVHTPNAPAEDAPSLKYTSFEGHHVLGFPGHWWVWSPVDREVIEHELHPPLLDVRWWREQQEVAHQVLIVR
jgi:hypothetical protein